MGGDCRNDLILPGRVSVTSIHLTRGPGSYFLALLLSSL